MFTTLLIILYPLRLDHSQPEHKRPRQRIYTPSSQRYNHRRMGRGQGGRTSFNDCPKKMLKARIIGAFNIFFGQSLQLGQTLFSMLVRYCQINSVNQYQLFVVTRCQIFPAKMHQFNYGWGTPLTPVYHLYLYLHFGKVMRFQ